jgi:outer membrane protein TolC
MANLGYNARNNFQGASSRSLLTNRQSLEPSTSSDRGIFTTQVGLAWNVLDFGVAYFKAHANADKVLSREEQKRKAINRISQDVCTAYWRAVSNERLKRDMEGLAGRIASALAQSKRVMNTKLTNPTAALTYQRELLTIQRELQQLQRNLTLAKNQLAALVNLRPDQPFELAIPERMDAFPELKRPIAELERTALENRPELRDLAYQRRTNVSEARAALVAMLPGLEFGGSYNTSDNSFLWERDWWSVGSQVAWNLINLIKYPAKMNEIEASNAVLDTERLAMSMAVLTQLHVSLAQYAHAQREFDTAADYQKTQAQLLEQTRIGERLGNTSEQGLIREEMNALVGEVRRDVAYSDLENARAAIFASIGTDPLPPDVDVNQPVAQLAQAVKTHWRKAGRI